MESLEYSAIKYHKAVDLVRHNKITLLCYLVITNASQYINKQDLEG